MDTVSIKVKSTGVVERLRERFKSVEDREKLLRPLCLDLVVLMTERIHINGLDANEQQIGTYSEKYAKLRERKYNRLDNEKIVFALTSQLENGWAVVPTQRGYGIGFTDKRNFDLVNILKKKYPKVFTLSKSERKYSIDFINDFVKTEI